jgi:hypothetical protein
MNRSINKPRLCTKLWLSPYPNIFFVAKAWPRKCMDDCAGGGKQNAHFFHGFTVYSNLHTLTEDGVEWGEVGQQGSY